MVQTCNKNLNKGQCRKSNSRTLSLCSLAAIAVAGLDSGDDGPALSLVDAIEESRLGVDRSETPNMGLILGPVSPWLLHLVVCVLLGGSQALSEGRILEPRHNSS